MRQMPDHIKIEDSTQGYDSVVASIDCDGCGENVFHIPGVKKNKRTLNLSRGQLNDNPLIGALIELGVSTVLNGSLRQCWNIDY